VFPKEKGRTFHLDGRSWPGREIRLRPQRDEAFTVIRLTGFLQVRAQTYYNPHRLGEEEAEEKVTIIKICRGDLEKKKKKPMKRGRRNHETSQKRSRSGTEVGYRREWDQDLLPCSLWGVSKGKRKGARFLKGRHRRRGKKAGNLIQAFVGNP